MDWHSITVLVAKMFVILTYVQEFILRVIRSPQLRQFKITMMYVLESGSIKDKIKEWLK